MADYRLDLNDGEKIGYLTVGDAVYAAGGLADGDTITLPYAAHAAEEAGIGLVTVGTGWDITFKVLYETGGASPVEIPLNVGSSSNYTGAREIGTRVEPSTPTVRIDINTADSAGTLTVVWSITRGLV